MTMYKSVDVSRLNKANKVIYSLLNSDHYHLLGFSSFNADDSI